MAILILFIFLLIAASFTTFGNIVFSICFELVEALLVIANAVLSFKADSTIFDSNMFGSDLNNCRPMNKISMAAIAKEALIRFGVNIILRTGASFLYKDFLKSGSSLASISGKRYKNILSSISILGACNFVFSNNANAAAYFGSVKTKASTAALSAAFNSLSINDMK